MWLPQAALIALFVGFLADGDFALSPTALALGILAVGLVRTVLEALGARLAFRHARRFLTGIRAQTIDALSTSSPLDATRAPSGKAASVVTEQAELLVPYAARYQIARWRAAIVPGVIVLVVMPFSWAAALALLLAAPVIPVFMVLIGWRAQKASEEQLQQSGTMNAFVLDRLRGLATIRGLDAVEMTARRIRDEAERMRSRTMAVVRIAFLSSAVLELFSAIGVAMVAVYVGFHLLGALTFGAWGATLSLSEGLFVLLLAPAFFEPLRELSAVWHDRSAGEAALAELRRLGSAPTQIAPRLSTQVADVHRLRTAVGIRVANVSFSHIGTDAVALEGIDIDIRPGEHMALLGPSGSGKSTLLALIAGLAIPDTGTIIFYTGSSPAEHTDELPRLAWVGQRPHIFAGTLRSNIALGRGGIERETLASALAFAKLDALAETRRGAIGEGGVGLSGGETLRLALARAAVDPSAQIILADEPTAHLDHETADDIAAGLLRLARGRTLIVATHDPALARRMDRVIRIEASHLERAA